MTKITVVYGCWITNIGNAFLDLGSVESLKQAKPGVEINTTSSFPRWLFYMRNKQRFKLLNDFGSNYFSLMSLVDVDFAVFSGMVLSRGFIERYGKEILKLKKKGTQIIFNGAGASQYNEEEIKKFRAFLTKVKPLAFISRDSKSFSYYHDLAKYSYNGIDCAFFLNNCFKPSKLNLGTYDVHTFDSMEDPVPKKEVLIIRTHHSPGIKLKRKYFAKSKTLISDQPGDYLNLYAHAREVHSDRVHACIATLSFGNKCQLYSPTPRAQLFEKVGIKAEEIRKRPIKADQNKLLKAKREQVKFLKSILK